MKQFTFYSSQFTMRDPSTVIHEPQWQMTNDKLMVNGKWLMANGASEGGA